MGISVKWIARLGALRQHFPRNLGEKLDFQFFFRIRKTKQQPKVPSLM